MNKRPGIHAGVNFSSGTPGHPAGCRKCSTPKNRTAIAINTRPTVMSLLLPCPRSEEHTSELQSRFDLVCRLLLEKKNKKNTQNTVIILTIQKSYKLP